MATMFRLTSVLQEDLLPGPLAISVKLSEFCRKEGKYIKKKLFTVYERH